jgi:hypothetical protein
VTPRFVLRFRELVDSPAIRSALERGSDTLPAFALRAVERVLCDHSRPHRETLNLLWDVLDDPHLNRALGSPIHATGSLFPTFRKLLSRHLSFAPGEPPRIRLEVRLFTDRDLDTAYGPLFVVAAQRSLAARASRRARTRSIGSPCSRARGSSLIFDHPPPPTAVMEYRPVIRPQFVLMFASRMMRP